jgi:plasmid stabilization system protein ParE
MSDNTAGYLLTETAETDFLDARNWSLQRWGSDLTATYFADLHKAAEYVAANHKSLAGKDHLTGTTGLGVYAAREHYLIYMPLNDRRIAIVALIRQGRDVPTILKNNSYAIRKEVEQLQRR